MTLCTPMHGYQIPNGIGLLQVTAHFGHVEQNPVRTKIWTKRKKRFAKIPRYENHV